ncbi:RNase A-like domain-containing protein [Streptomyces sp. NPDC101221]|uniref:RNase A-like domain-containing protein n=1 Tax=Streptomyces sp. NPDC101221 TaxID=3366132 RepID=UPI00380D123B
MGLPDTPTGHGKKPDLRVSDDDLTKLADDLDDMQDHLDKQVKRMDGVVDRVEAGWHGPAGTAYRGFHRAAAEDRYPVDSANQEGVHGSRVIDKHVGKTDMQLAQRLRDQPTIDAASSFSDCNANSSLILPPRANK